MGRNLNYTCVFVRPDGNRCKAYRSKGSIYCWAHDPDPQKQVEAEARQMRGGELAEQKAMAPITGPATAPTTPPKGKREIIEYITATMEAVRNGGLDHRRGEVVMRLGKLALEHVEEDKEDREEIDADMEIAKLKAVR